MDTRTEIWAAAMCAGNYEQPLERGDCAIDEGECRL